MFVPSVIAGMGLGYLSHIVADASNKGGIPFFFTNKQFSITKKMFGNKLSNFFKSGNKTFNYIFIAAGIDMVLFVIAPGMTTQLNKALFGSAFSILKGMFTVFMTVLVGAFDVAKGMIGS